MQMLDKENEYGRNVTPLTPPYILPNLTNFMNDFHIKSNNILC